MISQKAWPDFNSRFDVVACFIEILSNRGREILLLRRAEHKPQGGTLGLPAGKVDSGETWGLAIQRELSQETGINESLSTLACCYKGMFFVRYPEYDFRYLTFRLIYEVRPVITLNPEEHIEALWSPVREALNLPLIGDLDRCIKHYYGLV